MLLRVFAEEAFSVGRRIGPERPFISQMSLDPPRHVSEPHWCRVRRRSEGEYSVLRFSVSDLVERDPAVREHELETHGCCSAWIPCTGCMWGRRRNRRRKLHKPFQ